MDPNLLLTGYMPIFELTNDLNTNFFENLYTNFSPDTTVERQPNTINQLALTGESHFTYEEPSDIIQDPTFLGNPMDQITTNLTLNNSTVNNFMASQTISEHEKSKSATSIQHRSQSAGEQTEQAQQQVGVLTGKQYKRRKTSIRGQSSNSPGRKKNSAQLLAISPSVRHANVDWQVENDAPSKKAIQYFCESCPSTFGRRSDLARHCNSVHQSGRLFRCSFPSCTVAIYGRKDKLEEHQRKVHNLIVDQETAASLPELIEEPESGLWNRTSENQENCLATEDNSDIQKRFVALEEANLHLREENLDLKTLLEQVRCEQRNNQLLIQLLKEKVDFIKR